MANPHPRILSAVPDKPSLPAGVRRVEPLSDLMLGANQFTRPVVPNQVDEPVPEIIWVDPRELLIAESYQRGISAAGKTLIRKIIGGWSWRKFKPPAVARTEFGLEVIDGQHTAIGAATHPQINLIPILVTTAVEESERAGAFIAHNRDRVGITPMQMFFSSVAAGDETARAIKRICDRAGVTILRNPPAKEYPVNSTVAIAALKFLLARHAAPGAQRVVQMLAASGVLRPITANHIKAAEALLFDPEYKHALSEEAIVRAIRERDRQALAEAPVLAATHGIPQWKALTIVYYRYLRQSRRGTA